MDLRRIDRIRPHTFLLSGAMMLLCGCGASNNQGNLPTNNSDPLPPRNVNLIFVVSPDLQYQASGDLDPKTANLTAQGLQRTLLLAPYLQQKVLGGDIVTAIYALEPMTHPQTTSNYPDMAALETVQQFAMIDQFSMSSPIANVTPTVGNNFPINVSYAPGAVPNGVVTPSPLVSLPGLSGTGLQRY